MTLKYFLVQLLDVADKYFIVAGMAFLVVYVVLRKRIAWRKIQPRFPTDKDYRREIIDSTISILIFALSPVIILGVPEIRVHTQLYGAAAERGWVYFFLVFPLLFVVHDAYFYWMHRLIHHPRLFKLIHLEHHRSVNPSPWAAYAFGPIEAFLESMIFPIILFVIPVTVWHVFIFFLLSIFYNVYGHLGFELYPKGFQRTVLGRWVNTSVSHNQHHRYFKGNYGLYFLWWDRWMGTIREDYEKAFEEVTGRVRVGNVAPGAGEGVKGEGVKGAALLLIVSLLSLSVYGQKLPLVNFNHFYAVIDSTDLHALQKSSFIKNKFAALVIRTTKADNSETWTGTYFEGLDNYLELFDVSVGDPLGNAGLAFSVDRTGEINQLDSALSRKFTTEKRLRERQYDNRKIPWYTALGIKDPVFDSLSNISFWVMEYKPEYYDYNHWKYKDDKLTRTTYLSQYEDERRNKILKRFTGVTLHATDNERKVISGFLINCGYQAINDSSLASPENFVIHFIHRNINDRYAMASVEFETNMEVTDTIKISENIEVQVTSRAGKIIFK